MQEVRAEERTAERRIDEHNATRRADERRAEEAQRRAAGRERRTEDSVPTSAGRPIVQRRIAAQSSDVMPSASRMLSEETPTVLRLLSFAARRRPRIEPR